MSNLFHFVVETASEANASVKKDFKVRPLLAGLTFVSQKMSSGISSVL